MQDHRFRKDLSELASNVQHVVIASEAKQSTPKGRPARASGAEGTRSEGSRGILIEIAASWDSSQ
jgi:hypothetical protein